MKKFSALDIVQGLFALNAIIWTGLATKTVQRAVYLDGYQWRELAFFMGVMMFGNAGAFLLSAWLLPKKRMPVVVFVLLILLVNILLTFTDQVGFWDWTTVLIDFALVGILVGRWSVFVGSD